MFWAIEAQRVDLRGLRLESVPADIETLNRWALEGRLEVSALSLGAYPSVAEGYALLPHGASLGFGYGPIVVARGTALARGARAARDRDSRPPDDRLSRACARAGGRARRCANCPSTRSPTRSARAGPLRVSLIHEGQLPTRLRACTSCSISASGGRPRPACRFRSGSTSIAPRPRRRSWRRSRPCSPRRSRSGSTTATRRSPTPRASAAASTARPPTASSRCT